MFGLYRRIDRVDRLIARGSYPRAIELIEERLSEGQESVRLIQQLAALHERTGSHHKAVALLLPLVDHFAEAGFVAKSIAVLKRIERLEPGQQRIEERLGQLIHRRQTEIDDEMTSREVRSGVASRPPAIGGRSIDVVRVRASDAAHEKNHTAEEVASIGLSPLFASVSSVELVALIRGFGLSTFEPGEILVSEGEPGDSLFILASGSVRVYARDRQGHNKQARILRPPQFFGEISLFEGSARTMTVVAATACELLQLDRATLEMIGDQHPDFPQILRLAASERAGSPEEREARGEIELPI